MKPAPHFRASITVTRGRTIDPHKGCFVFGEDGQRRVPMEMDGVEGLNTVGIWVDEPRAFPSGSTFQGVCRVIHEPAFRDAIKSGLASRLWDGGFFAEGRVIEVFRANWRHP
jgi:hypothetical protein